ncbi:hypothetical protein CYMTET_30660 [Cymbomonas tetramitiformis]|uniref:alpha-1,2-Mannosidase n=1 Tax=Cymbomonas tetramitiformis TaxID=36881 RepID=A0AAE0FIL8_9CHLO|nr:hypothetical protein CYMTET_30660 [Cymbomonas tetramitiformis]
MFLNRCFCFLLLLPPNYTEYVEDHDMAQKAKEMFYHAYDAYMLYAFPHDELKPLSRTYTNSLGELGNLRGEHLSKTYNGVALTLIDSLSTLAVLGNSTEFAKAVQWISSEVNFDVDVRVNVFECNIRVLGGLLSAHQLASNRELGLMSEYDGGLLTLAFDLGKRLLPAFHKSPTGIPYAWVNLKHGVRKGETTETNTAGCGSLIIEMGVLSRLTGDERFEMAALRGLRKLWSLRSSHDLMGTSLNVSDGTWISLSGGIGAGGDSFYEYLMKSYILFGEDEYYDMFHDAYLAVLKHMKHGPWYHEANMNTARPTHLQFSSLQAFWPGLQVLAGDLKAAMETHEKFFGVWKEFGVLPERYLWKDKALHPTEKYYPLRPEFVESTYALYHATKDPRYRDMGRVVYESLQKFAKVNTGGYAAVKDVRRKSLEDHQHSFFLAETCKYLYLLFDDSFMSTDNYIFSTEGHPMPVRPRSSQHFFREDEDVCHGDGRSPAAGSSSGTNPLASKICPNLLGTGSSEARQLSTCHQEDRRLNHRCTTSRDCGVAADTCLPRSCSQHGFCY